MKLFDAVATKKPKSNVFDLSHEKKLSMDMAELVPIFLQEVVPGDVFKVSSEMLVRLAPMIAPMMHRVNVYTHFFFVPNRLVWNEWEDFITGGVDGLSIPTFPVLSVNDSYASYFGVGSLADYMGVPPPPNGQISAQLEVSALPFRAYQMIWNEYYRDQTLQTKLPFGLGGTVSAYDHLVLTTLRKRCWEKDYFTSALPFLQRGADVNIPIQGTVTPEYLDTSLVLKASDGTPLTGDVTADGGNAMVSTDEARIENLESSLDVTYTGVTINELRQATRLQQWLERNSYGSRYIEQILLHFGIKSSDARLQRPEYLGGGKTPLVISEVLQTADTENAPTGQMAGHGVGVGNTNTFKRFFEEHGWIIGIVSILPRTSYQEGIEKQLIKFDKFDYYFPEFAHLGEQAVLNKELYHDYHANPDDNETEFGYQSRYAEYKFKQSSVHGDFKQGLNFWHMGRIFGSRPDLNGAFVESDPTTRVFAVQTLEADHVWVNIYNNVRAIRPMPYFGTPKL